MQSRENPVLPQEDGEQVQLWQRKKGAVPHWLNMATKTPQAITSPPVLGRGGIMADAMGLGKTLTVLSLIIAGKQEKTDGFCKSTLIGAMLRPTSCP
jgi:SWI/SNF-related matrix-associated actin-dependent regulator of chromatin subfamily A3